MSRREMTIRGLMVLGVVVGIVAGNFVLHRWLLGNATSREADAGVAPTSVAADDLAEFAPQRRRVAQVGVPTDSAARLEQLRTLIAEKLPHASVAEREAWSEELKDVSLQAAAGILDLREQVGAFPELGSIAIPEPTSINSGVISSIILE